MTNRLTEKTKIGYFAQYDRWSGDNKPEIIEKCGKYEDVEEKWGCPIDIVDKALENGFYVKQNNGTILYRKEDENHILCLRHLGCMIEICWIPIDNNYKVGLFEECNLALYGHYWALTKEELESK